MAVKDKETPKPTISAAPVAIKTTVDATAAQKSPAALKATTDTRLKADPSAALLNSTRAVADAAQKEEKDALSRWVFMQDMKYAEEIYSDSIEDINYHLLTEKELAKKGDLDTEDVFRADTRDERVAGMAVLRVDENTGSRFYTGNHLSSYLASHPQHAGRMTNMGEAQRQVYQTQFPNIEFGGPTLLNPRLADKMRKDPTVAAYVEMTFAAAKRNNLDPVMLANQFYQESKFNPNAVSGAGARGIAQIMPFHQGKLGLRNEADFFDPAKSIEAGAEKMGGLTRKLGDQRLALVAYNGGEKAIDFVEAKLGKKTVTFDEWQGFMTERRAELGTKDRGAWHNETLGYTEIIAGTVSGGAAAKTNRPVQVASIAAPELIPR